MGRLALQICEVLSASQKRKLVEEPETHFNTKWPFNVIQGHLFRRHRRATKGRHSCRHNNCGLRCEDSENMAGEISENRHFRRPHSHLKLPLQRTPTNIHINITLLETRIPGLHFCPRQYMGSSANFQTVLSASQECQLIS